MLKVMVIFGTRPEAIKLAPVILEMEKCKEQIENFIIVTAQHREMLDQVLHLFSIKPDYDLNLMKTDQSLSDITSYVIRNIEKIIIEVKPDIILVQGDTTTTFASSLAGFYQKIKIGHVEAGLRTNDKYRPFPEEINRRLTSHIADFHFAPTEMAKNNLLSEGISKDKIFITGNTVIDTLKKVTRQQCNTDNDQKWNSYFTDIIGFSVNNFRLILVTGHRRENFGQGFDNICQSLKEIALKNSDTHLIYPVHLNPNVQKPVKAILDGIKNIHLVKPLEYAAFVYLMSKSYLILTDSGGIQEEASALGKPVLVMREITERHEALEAGTVKLVGTSVEQIVRETQNLLENEEDYRKMSQTHDSYGDGKASERIVNILLSIFE